MNYVSVELKVCKLNLLNAINCFVPISVVKIIKDTTLWFCCYTRKSLIFEKPISFVTHVCWVSNPISWHLKAAVLLMLIIKNEKKNTING